MKKHALSLLFGLISIFGFSQIVLVENFDAGLNLPAGWTTSAGDYFGTINNVCDGFSLRVNLNNTNTDAHLTSPNFVGASNGTNLAIVFDYKIVDWSAAIEATPPGWGEIMIQYSTNDGANWNTIQTINDSNHITSDTCANWSVEIPGASVPLGSDFKFRINSNWTEGSYYIYIDNVSVTQVHSEPPSCVNLITPSNGSTGVSINSNLEWSVADNIPLGYTVVVGTTPGGTDITDNVNAGLSTFYNLPVLEYATTYYVSIIPFNDNGSAIDCPEWSFVTEADPTVAIDCAAIIPLNTVYCYDNNETITWSFQSSDGSPLNIFFNAGQFESCCDDIVIYDGTDNTGVALFSDGLDDMTGVSVIANSGFLFVEIVSDGSTSCQTNSYIPVDFDVFCLDVVGRIEVNAFIDENSNSIFDDTEINFNEGVFTYELNNDGVINYVNSTTGSFMLPVLEEGDTYDIGFTMFEEYNSCLSQTFNLFEDITASSGETIQIDFPLELTANCNDLAVYLTSNVSPRPGFLNNNTLIIANLGLLPVSGSVEFTHDASVALEGVYNVDSGNTITNTATGFILNFNDLQPLDEESVLVKLEVPTTAMSGDLLTNSTVYNVNDLNLDNNESILIQAVVNSYDPNDKMESHGPEIKFDDFTDEDYLFYTIRFQNFGTAEAIDIRIEDVLDSQLDVSTFKMLHASHDFVLTRIDNNLAWQFDDVNLPSESMDEPNSHGYVYFKIKPTAGYALGDVIPNFADIYFDFNPAVTTNTFETEFVENLSVSEYKNIQFSIYPNPVNDVINIISESESVAFKIKIFDLLGKLVIDKEINESRLDLTQLKPGIYFLTIKQNNLLKKTIKIIKK